MTPCPACPGFRPVPACGPQPCPYLFLGAGPAQAEARAGEPYVGLAGQELCQTYLPIAGLRREDVRIGNASLCWDGTDRTPPLSRVLACARRHLPRLLDECKPEVVVLMGGVAKALCDLPLRLETHQGVPQWGSLLGGVWEGWVWPSYEPALGMRETGRMNQLIECFQRLGQWVRGEWTPPQPVERPTRYEVLHGELGGLWPTLAIDTEKDGSRPWSLQWSGRAGCGYMLYADDARGLAKFEAWRREEDPLFIFHEAVGDMSTLAKLGMGIGVGRWRDTMQESYQLCSLPQGLKPLAYRLLGVTMRSWADVVWPASVAAVCDWMERAADLAAGKLQVSETATLTIAPCSGCGKRGKAAVCKVCGAPREFKRVAYKAGAAEAVLRHVRAYTLASAADTDGDKKPYNPWDRLEEMKQEGLRGKVAERWEWEWLEENVGTTPTLSIANADPEQAVAYAIGDADMTGQVASELKRLRGGERWRIAAEDRDV